MGNTMKYKEKVIGFQINGVIYTGVKAIKMFKAAGNYERVITKQIAQFMAALDLGYQWEQLAKAPIILIIEDGEIRLPTLEENEYKYYVWDKNNTVKQERFEHLE